MKKWVVVIGVIVAVLLGSGPSLAGFCQGLYKGIAIRPYRPAMGDFNAGVVDFNQALHHVVDEYIMYGWEITPDWLEPVDWGWDLQYHLVKSFGEEEEEELSDFLTYESFEYGFSIEYPREWIKEEEKEEDSLLSGFSPSKEDLEKENLVVAIAVEMMEEMSLDESIEMMLYEPRRIVDFRLLESIGDSLGGYPAHRIVYTGKENEYDFKFTIIWTMHDGKFYAVMFGFEADEYPKWIGTFEKMVDSFKLFQLTEVDLSP